MIPSRAKVVLWLVFLLSLLIVTGRPSAAEDVGRGGVYSVVELTFHGPVQGPGQGHRLLGALPPRRRPGRAQGPRVLRRRRQRWHPGRCLPGPLLPPEARPLGAGRGPLQRRGLDRPRQGDFGTATPSEHHGFWVVDPDSPGRRWYMRSDGSHQYVLGNTYNSFLSGFRDGGRPSGNDIAQDVSSNAGYFKKLRFALHGDRYPQPTAKPFLDDEGRPTDDGDFSRRPDPAWFHGRVDLAVRTAFDHDLIADLILCGPDTEASRSTLRAGRNGGDPTPYLKEIRAFPR